MMPIGWCWKLLAVTAPDPTIPPRFALWHSRTKFCVFPDDNSATPTVGIRLIVQSGCDVTSDVQAFRFLPSGAIQHIASELCISTNATDLVNPASGSVLILVSSCTESLFEYTTCGDTLRHKASGMCVQPLYDRGSCGCDWMNVAGRQPPAAHALL